MTHVLEGKQIHTKLCPKTERKDGIFKNQKRVASMFLKVLFNKAVNS
jgi:hypothetical protein